MPSLPRVVSSLFRGHQVLGDRAPEFPPDPAQQNTLATPFPHNCLSVRTSLDQALATQQRRGPKTISCPHSLGSQQTSTKEAQFRLYPPEKSQLPIT